MARKPIPIELKKQLYTRQGGKCALCSFDRFEIHHIKEYHIENKHELNNLLLVCDSCHRFLHDLNGVYKVEIVKSIKSELENLYKKINYYRLLIQNKDYLNALNYFESDLHKELIINGWYQYAQRLINYIDLNSLPDPIHVKFYQLLSSEILFWSQTNNLVKTRLRLNELSKYLTDFDKEHKFEYYNLNGRVITYLVDDNKEDAELTGDKNISMEDAIFSFENALKYSLDIAKDFTIHSSIASCLRSNEDFDKAIKSCEYGLKIAEQTKNTRSMASNLDRLGSLYCQIGKYEIALKTLYKAFILSTSINYRRLMSYSARNISSTFFHMGSDSLDKSIAMLILSNNISNSFNDPNSIWNEQLRDEIDKSLGYQYDDYEFSIKLNWSRIIKQTMKDLQNL